MYVCVKQACQNYATNMKISIFIPYDIYLIRTKFGTFTLTCMIVPKGWCCPFSVLCLSDASPIIADNCNALCPIPPSAVRSVSTWLISYVNTSLFVTQSRSSVRRSVILVSKVSLEIFRRTIARPMSPCPVWS